MEQLLCKKQSLLHNILEGTTDLIAALDLDFKFIAFNSAYKAEFLKIFGREIAIGTSLIEALAHLPQEQAKAVAIWGRALAGEQFTVIEAFGDRERNYYEITYSSIRNENEHLIGASHIVKNISHRRQVEEELRLSKERLQLALEASGDGLWDWNVKTGELYLSPEWIQMLGYDLDELPRHISTWERLIHPEDKAWVLERLDDHLKDSSVSYNFDYRLRTKSGEWKWITNYGKVVAYNEKGLPLRMVGTHKDITERKQTERVMELQTVIIQNMAKGICLVRVADSAIVYANPKFEKMFGYGFGELQGKPVAIINYAYDSSSAERVHHIISSQVMKYGEATYEVHNVKKDGTPFWCRATTSKFEHPEYGTVLVAVQQDITEQKQAEEKIKASLKEKEVLLKEIHHRVKNNLQIVTSLLQMQCRRLKEQTAALALQDSKNRIISIALVHEKLYRSEDLSRINFGQYIPDLIAHLFDTYKVSSKTIDLKIDVTEVFLEIDTAIPYGLIINELVSNSLKYAFPKNYQEKKWEIHVKFLINSNGTHTLIIQDNGIGISKDFDIKTTTSLGLTLVQALVEQLKGKIELEQSQGTFFKMSFSGKKHD